MANKKTLSYSKIVDYQINIWRGENQFVAWYKIQIYIKEISIYRWSLKQEVLCVPTKVSVDSAGDSHH